MSGNVVIVLFALLFLRANSQQDTFDKPEAQSVQRLAGSESRNEDKFECNCGSYSVRGTNVRLRKIKDMEGNDVAVDIDSGDEVSDKRWSHTQTKVYSLKDPRIEDSGEYVCEIVSPAGNVLNTKKVSLEVEEKPTVRVEGGYEGDVVDQEAQENHFTLYVDSSNTLLTCDPRGRPTPQSEFKFSGDPNKKVPEITISGNEMTINHNKMMVGQRVFGLVCSAGNTAGKVDLQFSINKLGAPSFEGDIQEEFNLNNLQNEEIYIEFEFRGSPTPSIKFFKDSEEFFPSTDEVERGYFLQRLAASPKGLYTNYFAIKKPTGTETGAYEIRAENNFDRDSISFRVTALPLMPKIESGDMSDAADSYLLQFRVASVLDVKQCSYTLQEGSKTPSGPVTADVMKDGELYSLRIAGLQHSTRYTVKVRAINAAGTGASSDPHTFTTAEGEDAPATAKPDGVTAKVTKKNPPYTIAPNQQATTTSAGPVVFCSLPVVLLLLVAAIKI